MNCTEAKEWLITGQDGPELDEHLAHCSVCRQEQVGWQRLRAMLDAAPVPRVRVDVRPLYAEADRRRQQQLRRWRRMAFVGAAVAAALLLVIGLKLQVRAEPGAITVRWGPVREQKSPLPIPPQAVPTPPATTVTAEDMQLANDLIHALAARVDTLDERQRRTATVLALRLQALAQRTQDWQAAQQQRTAFHPTENQDLEYGEKP